MTAKYQVLTTDYQSFIFNISSEYQYKVIFTDGDLYLDKPVGGLLLKTLSFNYFEIDKELRKSILNDEVLARTRATLISIIQEYITRNKCSLVFVCDSLDSKHFGRAAVFKQWDNMVDSNLQLIIKNVKANGQDYIVGILPFNKEHESQLRSEILNSSLINK